MDDVERRKVLPLPAIELRPLARSARSQSLYRLRYHGSPLGKIALLIYSLFNDFGSSDYVASSGRWIRDWKGCGRKWLWPNMRYYPNIWLEGNPQKYSVRMADSPPKYKSWSVLSLSYCHLIEWSYGLQTLYKYRVRVNTCNIHLVRKPSSSIGFLLILASCVLVLPFDPESGGSTFLRNAGKLLSDYTASKSASFFLFAFCLPVLLFDHGDWGRWYVLPRLR
jgi:hypothetical protein